LLDAFLTTALGLVAASPDGGVASGATYRVLHRECSDCRLKDSLPQLRGLKDCGTSPTADAGAWSECVRSALKSTRPFCAGSDDFGPEVFGRDRDGGLWFARYERDERSGVGSCGAVIWRERCSRLELQPWRGLAVVRCASEPEDVDFPCQGRDRVRETLSAPLSVRGLRCAWRMDDEHKQCVEDAGAVGWTPVASGPSLLCLEVSDGLRCFPNTLADAKPMQFTSLLVPRRPGRPCESANLSAVDDAGEHWTLTQPDGGERECPILPGTVDWPFLINGIMGGEGQ
jgi:hypothetical protein